MESNGNGNLNQSVVIDLDALFGEQAPITVVVGGAEYPMVRVDALDLKEYAKLERLYARSTAIKTAPGDDGTLSDTQLTALEAVVAETLNLIAPTLPLAGMKFNKRWRLIELYFDQIKPAAAEKKMRAPKPITDTRSRRSRSGTRSPSRT